MEVATGAVGDEVVSSEEESVDNRRFTNDGGFLQKILAFEGLLKSVRKLIEVELELRHSFLFGIRIIFVSRNEETFCTFVKFCTQSTRKGTYRR